MKSIGGHPVKNVMLRYPLQVVRFDVGKEVKPWSLALAGDKTMRPELLTKNDVEQSFRRTGVK